MLFSSYFLINQPNHNKCILVFTQKYLQKHPLVYRIAPKPLGVAFEVFYLLYFITVSALTFIPLFSGDRQICHLSFTNYKLKSSLSVRVKISHTWQKIPKIVQGTWWGLRVLCLGSSQVPHHSPILL
jgi:hypothetical protein